MLTPVGQMGYMVESSSKSFIQTAHHLQKVYTLFFGHLPGDDLSPKVDIGQDIFELFVHDSVCVSFHKTQEQPD